MWSSAVNTSMLVEAPPPLVEDYSQTRTTIYMGFASFVILIWEHAITFSDEVEYIWRGRKGFFVVLFFINRYLTPLSFLGNLYAYLSSSWTHEKCKHFVRYEGAMIVIALNVTGLMMLMRIHALYRWKPAVVWCTACILAAEFSVNTWLVTHGKPVRHNRGNHSALACTMIFDVDKVGHMGAASAWLPLTYDTVILLLTLYHTLGLIRNKTAGRTAKVLLQDGILYYSVIFSINLVLTIMIASAPPGVQNITAQTEQLFTVAMMSRITIHLRKQGRAGAHDDTSYPTFSQQLDGPVVPIPRFFQSDKMGKRGGEEQGVKVAVQETSVTHDDRGVVVVKAGPGATEEWIEMRAPSPALLSRGEQRRDSQVRFMV